MMYINLSIWITLHILYRFAILLVMKFVSHRARFTQKEEEEEEAAEKKQNKERRKQSQRMVLCDNLAVSITRCIS